MGDHTATSLATQERNPRSAVLRTVLAAVVGLFPLLNGVLLAVMGALEPYRVYLPGWVFLGLNGTLLAATALAAVVTRVLAVPGVNEWLRSTVCSAGSPRRTATNRHEDQGATFLQEGGALVASRCSMGLCGPPPNS